jgi:CDP-diacylglycerol--serine O-phosphatidyltransferase
MQRFFWLVAAAYVCCAAIRLARFNVENEEDESAHMNFIGLPTPAAAGVVVSLVIFHQEILPELAEVNPALSGLLDGVIIYTMPFLGLGIALLMVSRIRYAHILNQYMKGKKPFWYLLWSLLVVGLVIWVRQLALVAGFCGFAASGFVTWLYRLIRSKVRVRADSEQPQVAMEHGNSD